MNFEEIYISGKSRLTYTSFGFVTAEFYDADIIYYSELYKAVVNGHWESASELLEREPQLLSAQIGIDNSPVLHIAVELGEARMGFVEKLVECMPSEALDLKDSDGATALFNAARAGNIKAVKLLVNKNPRLPTICQRHKFAPLHSAVKYGHKELTLYLLSVTSDDVDPSPFEDKPGIELLRRALMVGFHGELYLPSPIYFIDMNYCRVPLYNFIICRCSLATCNFADAKDSDDDKAPLTVLAERPWAFRSGSRFNLWQLIIYHC